MPTQKMPIQERLELAVRHTHLTMRQELLLGDWARDHEPECRTQTYAQLAEHATLDIGFMVTASNMASVCIARFGMKRPRVKKQNAIEALTTRISECERRLTTAGL